MSNQEPDTDRISASDLDAVIQFLPYFANPNNEFYETDRSSILEPCLYSREVADFLHILFKRNLICRQFDWTSWHDEAENYRNNPNLMDNADLDIVIKLLTTHVRADRFVGGHLADIIDSSHLLRILQRLAEIRKERFP